METQEITDILNYIFRFIGVAGVVVIITGITFVIAHIATQNRRFNKHLKEGDPVSFYIGEDKYCGKVLYVDNMNFIGIEYYDVEEGCNYRALRHKSDLCPRFFYYYKTTKP